MIKKTAVVNSRLSAKQIEKALFLEYRDNRNYKYFSSNSYAMGYEADFVAVTLADFVIEFEIKRDKYDFLNDFKNKKEKHESIKNGNHTNYFYFVCEEGIIDVSQLPSYCGLIYISRGKRKRQPYLFHMIRTAPRMHESKISKDMIIKLQTTIINKYYTGIAD